MTSVVKSVLTLCCFLSYLVINVKICKKEEVAVPNTKKMRAKQFCFNALAISKLNKVSGMILVNFHPKFLLWIWYRLGAT